MRESTTMTSDARGTLSARWPVLKSYGERKLSRIAMPLGGIGTGTVSLGGRGQLQDWEIMNRPAKGFSPRQAFFAIRGASEGARGGEHRFARCLEGSLLSSFEGAHGSPAPHAGLPRFERSRFHVAYPLAQVTLTDPALPVSVRLEAFNPLIPPDPDRSGLPVAVLRFNVRNESTETLELSVTGVLENIVGRDGAHGQPQINTNERRTVDRLDGVLMRSDVVPVLSEQWGSVALTALGSDDQTITHRLDWPDLTWGDALLDFWDDLIDDGALDDRTPNGARPPIASLCAQRPIAPAADADFTFLITWHFPNRMSWDSGATPLNRVGNAYTTQFTDAWAVAEHVAAELGNLERDTVDFVSTFCASPLPAVVKEAALFNLSTLRTQTCFRTEDGTLFGWEGCNDDSGCCFGSCTHVWNYEQATSFLFGSLARSMRDVEFLHATDPDGMMSFRTNLPVERGTEHGIAAADGQMGCIMKLYRDWKLCADDQWLRTLWPNARKTLEFCWIPGGWDADQDGVMEGCQHNTMDVEYYGPNPQMGFWYLGALRAAEEMATALGESGFAARCRTLFASGSAWIDANLFNGSYYEHEVRPIANVADIAPGLRHGSMGAQNLSEPELQLGAGCLVDQLVGQYMSEVCGLGLLGSRDHIRQTLRSILRYNYRSSMADHFNHMRTYALGDESATLMASYPLGRRPVRPFPYFAEVMTGFEYTVAVHMIYEGLVDEGLELIAAIRHRYDGQRRNPFDEAECGHHYARAMASWAAVLALTGFHYDAQRAALTFTDLPIDTSVFWSTGGGWGTITRSPESTIAVRVHQGVIRIQSVTAGTEEPRLLESTRELSAGQSITV